VLFDLWIQVASLSQADRYIHSYAQWLGMSRLSLYNQGIWAGAQIPSLSFLQRSLCIRRFTVCAISQDGDEGRVLMYAPLLFPCEVRPVRVGGQVPSGFRRSGYAVQDGHYESSDGAEAERLQLGIHAGSFVSFACPSGDAIDTAALQTPCEGFARAQIRARFSAIRPAWNFEGRAPVAHGRPAGQLGSASIQARGPAVFPLRPRLSMWPCPCRSRCCLPLPLHSRLVCI
jgi:hypothetical protein